MLKVPLEQAAAENQYPLLASRLRRHPTRSLRLLTPRPGEFISHLLQPLSNVEANVKRVKCV